tara:strand:- start:202 stop:381 length:180 start_codon:yes stop_codon:yes gene_type:complete
MTTSTSNAETSIEFAIDNVLERLSLLESKDQKALLREYQEWLWGSDDELDILVINNMNQ